MNRTLRLFVYNHEFDVTRLVSITPARGWGGDGALGCVLGFGALHRVPAPLNEPAQGPGETLFDSTGAAPYSPAMAMNASAAEQSAAAASSPALFTPANMASTIPPVASGPPPRTAKTGRKPRPAASGSAFDDFLKEGEEKSRQLDRGSTPTSTGPVAPPPPKAGAVPPKSTSGAKPEEDVEEAPATETNAES